MKNCYVFGYAWSIAIAAFLTGCGGTQSVGGGPGSMPQATATRRAIANLVPSASYEVLHRFALHGRARSPMTPYGGLVDVNGTLYGTTRAGGQNKRSTCGAVYSITPGGATRTLYRFTGPDGCSPFGTLLNVNGTLYGTTTGGGAHGSGVVFSITTNGALADVYSFQGGSDGATPQGPLIDVNGTLYGTTYNGGNSGCPFSHSYDCGTVYSLTTGGVETVLYRFSGNPDGANPASALVDVNGTLYGTTYSGGTGYGTVYSVTTAGSEKVVYTFTGGADGFYPLAPLTDVNGTLYGTTEFGGALALGNVFSITTDGSEKTIYSFSGGTDGVTPVGGLLDFKGRLYGTTFFGGGTGCEIDIGCGTIYRVTTGGSEKILYIFAADRKYGAEPVSELVDVSGTLYGTTPWGGDNKACQGRGCGVVYALTP